MSKEQSAKSIEQKRPNIFEYMTALIYCALHSYLYAK